MNKAKEIIEENLHSPLLEQIEAQQMENRMRQALEWQIVGELTNHRPLKNPSETTRRVLTGKAIINAFIGKRFK